MKKIDSDSSFCVADLDHSLLRLLCGAYAVMGKCARIEQYIKLSCQNLAEYC